MTYLNFTFKYNIGYPIKSYKSIRTYGEKLTNTKILIYLLRIHYQLSFSKIAEISLISKQLSVVYYYDILKDGSYRQEANNRWEELTGDRQLPQAQRS